MACKPIHLQATGPRNDRQAMWEAIRNLGDKGNSFTVRDIRGQLQGATPVGKIREYCTCLTNGGYLKKQIQGHGVQTDYSLINDTGIDAPRLRKDGTPVTQGFGQERIWRLLRMMRSPLTARELTAHINLPDHPVILAAVTSYLSYLKRADYLITHGQGEQLGYMLIPAMDTGPLVPMVQRIKQVFDPNTGKVVWPKGNEE
ncbi:hypothetical protein [Candidatus Vondammii sp. HM_W22]|uniref:hypothetical protein n=1 Tax=Candidatus Vondammii sp. HM_W22 TaxID=2687299 RepID=UPI001F136BCE|nr:hypothetical protein [Candidatus Vondammii sp. HM_W22]